jgi:hypothetical protein
MFKDTLFRLSTSSLLSYVAFPCFKFLSHVKNACIGSLLDALEEARYSPTIQGQVDFALRESGADACCLSLVAFSSLLSRHISVP